MPSFLLQLAVAIAFIATLACGSSWEFYDYEDRQCSGPSKISHAISPGEDPGCEDLEDIADVLKYRWVKLQDVPDQCQVFYYTRREGQEPRQSICHTLQYPPHTVRKTCTLAQHLTGIRYFCLGNTTISTSLDDCPDPPLIDHTIDITSASLPSSGEGPACYKIPKGARSFTADGWSSLLSRRFYTDEECGKTAGSKEISCTIPSLRSCPVRDKTLILKGEAKYVAIYWNEGWRP